MEMKNGEIIGAIPALMELIQLPLPVRTSYQVAQLARAVEAAAQDFEAARARLVERFAERDESGEIASVHLDGQVQAGHVRIAEPAAFQAEMHELLEMSTTLAVTPLRLQELGSVAEVSPATLIALGPLLVEDPVCRDIPAGT